MADAEEDPYAVSSDSDDDTKPPPMINIGVDLKVKERVGDFGQKDFASTGSSPRRLSSLESQCFAIATLLATGGSGRTTGVPVERWSIHRANKCAAQ